MLDAEFIKYLASLGAGGAMSSMMFYFHLKTIEQHRTDLKDLLVAQHKMSDVFVRVIQENTASNTELSTLIKSIAGRRSEGPR